MILTKQRFLLTIYFVLMWSMTSCYSFRGSLPADIKTIYIADVKNKETREKNYGPEFTDQVLNAFIEDNSLGIAKKKNADLVLNCTIESIERKIASIEIANGQAQSSLEELVVSVRIECKNTKIDKNLVNKTVSEKLQISSQLTDNDREEKIRELLTDITIQIVDNVIGAW